MIKLQQLAHARDSVSPNSDPRAVLNALLIDGLSEQEGAIYKLIEKHGPITTNQIKTAINRPTNQIGVAIARLLKLGLIERGKRGWMFTYSAKVYSKKH